MASDFPYIVDPNTGDRRVLSCLPTAPAMRATFAPYAQRRPPIAFSEVGPFDCYKGLGYKIKDQNGRGACMGHGTATAMEVAYRLAYGQWKWLSAWYCYATINGGRDGGATVGDAFRSVQENGICPEEMVPYAEFRLNRIGAEAKAAAKLHRAENIYRIETEADLFTADCLGDPVAFGTMIGGGFSRVDKEGVPGGGFIGGGGHAMCIYGGYKVVNGVRHYRVINSWGTSYGIEGCCFMNWDMIAGTRYGPDLFAIVHPTRTPDEPHRPAPVAARGNPWWKLGRGRKAVA